MLTICVSKIENAIYKGKHESTLHTRTRTHAHARAHTLTNTKTPSMLTLI